MGYETKYQVIYDVPEYGSVDSEHTNLEAALERALELAMDQAEYEDIDPDTICTFINGQEWSDNWEAGAGPEGTDCEYWPHVERLDE